MTEKEFTELCRACSTTPTTADGWRKRRALIEAVRFGEDPCDRTRVDYQIAKADAAENGLVLPNVASGAIFTALYDGRERGNGSRIITVQIWTHVHRLLCGYVVVVMSGNGQFTDHADSYLVPCTAQEFETWWATLDKIGRVRRWQRASKT